MLKEKIGISKVFLACGYTDLRFGVDGLANEIQNVFQLNPFDEGTLFLFCGRSSSRIKGLLWEGDGFLLLYKRLENGRFKWPRSTDEMRFLDSEQYEWLMRGFSIEPGIHRAKVKKSFVIFIVDKIPGESIKRYISSGIFTFFTVYALFKPENTVKIIDFLCIYAVFW